jgi:hypothetical protein
MPKNSNRAQGGDVSGETKNDQERGLGEPITVAKASYDPGYSLETTLTDAGTDFAVSDLKQGYCGYGKATGER